MVFVTEMVDVVVGVRFQRWSPIMSCECAVLLVRVNNNFLVFFFQLRLLLQTIQSIMLRSGSFDFFLFSLVEWHRAPMMTLKANKIPKTHSNKTYWQDQTLFFCKRPRIETQHLLNCLHLYIHINKWIQIIYCMSSVFCLVANKSSDQINRPVW